MIRILLYGDIDLNLIDGSAVWLASLAEVLGGMPSVSVTVLQKTRLKRHLMTAELAALPNICFLDPWTMAERDPSVNAIVSNVANGRLSPRTAAQLISILDRETKYNVIFIRSLETATELVDNSNLAHRLWVYVTDPMQYTAPDQRAKLAKIAEECAHLVCQTDEAQIALASLLVLRRDDATLVLPPMIPCVSNEPSARLDLSSVRLGYSGKFSPPYMILEMLNAFDSIRACIPGAEFHIVGDKFHNVPAVAGFVETVTQRLTTTPGVVWHGGVSRNQANDVLKKTHIAASWRAASFDSSLEMSTKVLEYAAFGIPTLMNPSLIQRRIFGRDYPCYVSTQDEFIDRVRTLVSSPSLYANASRLIQTKASQFTYAVHRERLKPALLDEASTRRHNYCNTHQSKSTRPQPASMRSKLRLLFAGHDLKFVHNIAKDLSCSPNYEIRVDKWKGHNSFDLCQSEELLSWADIIYCEWCLGNAKWYSQRKRDTQRLFVRVHHQEMKLSYRHELDWDKVDGVIFTNYPHYNTFCAEQPELARKAIVMFCDVDCNALDQDKLPWANFNLGMVGINPLRKRPDWAFDILTRLRRIDTRYTLFFKTRLPWEYNWLWKRVDEREYFNRLFARIEASPCRNSIVIDPHGDDMTSWYAKVGFILSMSDHEGSHQAVAEGMAAGCIPVIRAWDGATPLYPARFVVSSIDEAVDLILGFRNSLKHRGAVAEAQNHARKSFDTPLIIKQILQLFDSAMAIRPLNSCSPRKSLASAT